MKRTLSIILALCLIATMLVVAPVRTAAQASTATQYRTVVGGWLRLRSGASFEASTISSYYTGTVVKVLGTSGDWYHVETPDGMRGYMYGQYLSSSGGGGTGTATIWSANGLGVRLRTGPGTGYRIIRVFPVGTVVTILESGSYWARIRVQGYEGYMMRQFLYGGGGGGGQSVVGMATIWSANGLGVRLRTGPGKNHGIIGVYSVGTRVALLSKGRTWDYVRINNRTGYMMNEFLIYDADYTVTSVTVTPSAVTLAAGATQAFASAVKGTGSVPQSVVWSVSGQTSTATVISSSGVLTLGANETAAKLKVRAMSTADSSKHGDATVTVTSGASAPVIGTQPQSQTVTVGDKATFTIAATGNPAPTYQWQSRANSSASWANISGATAATYSKSNVQSADSGSQYRCFATNVHGSVASDPATLTVGKVAAPVIGTQPQSQTVNVGDAVTLSVAASSPDGGTLSYQWYYEGTIIVGATASSYRIAPFAAANAGRYQCRVTNTKNGESAYTDSDVATLTNGSVQAPVITTQPQSQSVTVGGSVTLSVVASVTDGGTLSYEWYHEGAIIQGATAASYTINPFAATDAGRYQCRVINTKSGYSRYTDSDVATLTDGSALPPTINGQSSDETVTIGQSATLSVTASAQGGGTLSYQWYFEGGAISGATGSTYTINPFADTNAGRYQCRVTNTLPSGSSAYADTVVVTLSAAQPVTPVQPPTLGTLTANKYDVNAGESVSLSLTATSPDGGALSFEWWGPGGKITTETTGSITVSNFADTDAGYYQCRVYNEKGGATAFADSNTITLNIVHPVTPAQPPAITAQPQSATVNEGQSASFSVAATSPDGGTLSYEWYHNGALVATSASHQINSCGLSDAGNYQCRVINTKGGTSAYTDSAPVTLTVNPVAPTAQAPNITAQPQDMTADEGQPASFSVSASVSDGGTLSYNWWHNGVEIVSGSANNTLSIASCTAADAGNYQCEVINTLGSSTSVATSNPVVLTVNTPTP